MNKITLRPLLAFLHAQSKPYITRGDWEQLEAKITKRRAEKQVAGQNTLAEDEYLKMFRPVRDLFATQRQIKNTKVLGIINKILTASGYGYQKQKHKPRHRGNVFYPRHENNSTQIYDIAFYNAAAGTQQPGHHQHEDQPSVYYMRCEERGAGILFGNMQIDARKPELWEDPRRGELMLQKKNIYGMMVQQAIKHAVEGGKKEILFQCGDANELAQWNYSRLKQEIVTEKNYKKFQQNYQTKLNKFGSRGYAVGDKLPHSWGSEGWFYVVTEATADHYRLLETYWPTRNLLDRLKQINAPMPSGVAATSPADRVKLYNKISTDLFIRYRDDSYRAFYNEIKNAVKIITGHEPPDTTKALPLARLKKIFPRQLGYHEFSNQLDEFWHEFKLDEIILKDYTGLGKVVLKEPSPDESSVIYYNSRDKEINFLFTKSALKAPEIGKAYVVPRQDQYNINFMHYPPKGKPLHYKIYNWYEKTLEQEFKKHGISVEKVPITTTKRGCVWEAHAWKIKSGITQFKRRPMTAFAARTELKMDCETLPRLQAAALKFRIWPQHLTIVNDFLVGRTGLKKIGEHTPETGEVRLANNSLAVLAHEGLHKLKAQGVIPAKEYRALVRAGKRITENIPVEKAYINQRDPQDNLVYPPGPKRNEEYAALFVEMYYENNRRARKNLLNEKLTITEKVLDYFQKVCDTVQSRLGNSAALARKFLRKIEAGYYDNYQPEQANIPRRIFPKISSATLGGGNSR